MLFFTQRISDFSQKIFLSITKGFWSIFMFMMIEERRLTKLPNYLRGNNGEWDFQNSSENAELGCRWESEEARTARYACDMQNVRRISPQLAEQVKQEVIDPKDELQTVKEENLRIRQNFTSNQWIKLALQRSSRYCVCGCRRGNQSRSKQTCSEQWDAMSVNRSL